jgi:uroporphyrinogen-III synthase
LRIWITRTQPGASDTAERLCALGHEPVIDPVLEVRKLTPKIDLDGVTALAFTSRNGVEAFAALSPTRDLPLFVVGDATADAARAAGFASVRSAGGDVEALAELINVEGLVLCPGAAEPATDLPTLLARRGVETRAAAVYETVALHPTTALSQLAALDAVLVHSPKAARVLAGLIAPAAAPHLLFACISEKAAKPLIDAGHQKLRAAQFPDEAGLLKLLPGR